MKSYRKIIIFVFVILALSMYLCSCRAPNTVSSGTTYKLALVTSLYPDAGGKDYESRAMLAMSEQTVSGCAWAALKDCRKTDSANKTADKLDGVKYYIPADAEGNEKKSYSEAFSEAAVKQIELAVTNGAEIIVLTSDDFSGAYASVKDATKKYGEIYFVIITVPGSEFSENGSLNAKTTAVVIDTAQYGYLFGYFAAEKGYEKPGYIGAENAASRAFVTGLKAGFKDAGKSEDSVVIKYTVSGPVGSVIEADVKNIASDADILIGDELTMSYVAASGNTYASIYSDDNAAFCVTIKSDALKAKLTGAIMNANKINTGTVINLSAVDGIFESSVGEIPADIPEITVAANAQQ